MNDDKNRNCYGYKVTYSKGKPNNRISRNSNTPGISLSSFGNPLSQCIKEDWKRFLDDYFILWKENTHNFLEFKTHGNYINQNIQFKMQYNQKQFPFLDILVNK